MKRQLKAIVSIFALTLLASACASDQTTRADDGEIVEGGDLGVFAVKVGDCVNVPDGLVSEFEGVACDEPHDAQAIALFDVTEAEFPGQDEISEIALLGCAERFEAFMGITYEASIYFLSPVSPSQITWDDGDREVICLVVKEDQSKLTVDLEGSAA